MRTTGSKLAPTLAMTCSNRSLPPQLTAGSESEPTETSKAGVVSNGSGVPSERKPCEGVKKPKPTPGIGTAVSIEKKVLAIGWLLGAL